MSTYNYNEMQGYQLISPVSAIKKADGEGSVGTQRFMIKKFGSAETGTHCLYTSVDIGTTSSAQTSLGEPSPESYFASMNVPVLLPATKTVIAKVENWPLTLKITVRKASQKSILPRDSEIIATFGDGEEIISRFNTEDNPIHECTNIEFRLYKTQVNIIDSDDFDPKEDVDCIMIGAYGYGEMSGFYLHYTICEIGWIPNYYGITPNLETVTVKYEETSYGGGGRTGDNDSNPEELPDLPNFNYAAHGVRTYLLTEAQGRALHSFLWSNDFVDNLIKMYAQPMQTIESMFVDDIGLSSDISTTVVCGNVDTGVSATVPSQFVTIDCGSVTYHEEYASYVDYEPYVSMKLYLPKIGYVPISANDVVNNTIYVYYQVDLVTGFGTCYVRIHHTREGFTSTLMQIPNQILTSIPYSGTDASARVMAAANAGMQILGGNLLGAAENAIATNIAPYNIMKTPVSSSLLLNHKKPALLVDRVRTRIPTSYASDVGFMCQVTDKLNGKTGFFKIKSPHTGLIWNDYRISEEIDRLLEAGVYMI